MDNGIIEKASSAANKPMIAVIKDRPGQAEKVKLVMNSIKLNNFISERHFPIQSSQEILFNHGNVINELNNSRQIGYFTSLDIKSAFHTILLAKSDRLYTAFSFERT